MVITSNVISTFESLAKFTTARLEARRITAEDLDKLAQMDSDPKVMATLGGVKTLNETKERLSWNLKQWDEYGHGLWLFYTKENLTWIGRASVRHMIVDNLLEVELGYAVLSDYWRKGYATEMARACIDISFQHLNYKNITCFTITGNIASQKVIKNLGFSYEKDCMHANLPHVFYRLQNPYVK